jgi:hypothetical protein
MARIHVHVSAYRFMNALSKPVCANPRMRLMQSSVYPYVWMCVLFVKHPLNRLHKHMGMHANARAHAGILPRTYGYAHAGTLKIACCWTSASLTYGAGCWSRAGTLLPCGCTSHIYVYARINIRWQVRILEITLSIFVIDVFRYVSKCMWPETCTVHVGQPRCSSLHMCPGVGHYTCAQVHVITHVPRCSSLHMCPGAGHYTCAQVQVITHVQVLVCVATYIWACFIFCTWRG